jgi:hypothetical protein
MIVEFIDENGGGAGVRLRKARRKKLRPTAWQPLRDVSFCEQLSRGRPVGDISRSMDLNDRAARR